MTFAKKVRVVRSPRGFVRASCGGYSVVREMAPEAKLLPPAKFEAELTKLEREALKELRAVLKGVGK